MSGATVRWQWVMVALLLVLVVALLWSRWGHGALMAMQREANPWVFFGVMAVLPALGIPITPLFILAGTTFGARAGLVGSAVALSLNLTLCYWIARSGLRRWLEPHLRRYCGELQKFEGAGQETLRFVLMVKLAPGLPAFAKNYLLGMAGVPFALYFALSMLITGAFGASLVVLGESLFEHDIYRLIVAAAVIIGLVLVFAWWRRRKPAVTGPP
jgi:uncharacterized membrane protein YdjX (TVP38/TMEM64 family)